jgi:hypothetical protein
MAACLNIRLGLLGLVLLLLRPQAVARKLLLCVGVVLTGSFEQVSQSFFARAFGLVINHFSHLHLSPGSCWICHCA